MNLCCGTAAEGMEDPAVELPPLVRDLCERKKVFNIHFRNINGGLMNFQEVAVYEHTSIYGRRAI
jgi:mannonate dehydratase